MIAYLDSESATAFLWREGRSLFCGEKGNQFGDVGMRSLIFTQKVRSQFKFLVHRLRVDLYFEVFVENNDARDEYAQFLGLAQLFH